MHGHLNAHTILRYLLLVFGGSSNENVSELSEERDYPLYPG